MNERHKGVSQKFSIEGNLGSEEAAPQVSRCHWHPLRTGSGACGGRIRSAHNHDQVILAWLSIR